MAAHIVCLVLGGLIVLTLGGAALFLRDRGNPR